MTAWLEPARRALDAAPAPVLFFFRDDDVGWDDDALMRLLDVFAEYGVHVDLAVIPSALTPGLAGNLLTRRQAISFHQHGYAHLNHEREGRKCEFGPSRSIAEQHADIARGRDRLTELLPSSLSLFTPPWNRCTSATAQCLVELGIGTLSRDVSAGLVGVAGLRELPITFDFAAKRKGTPLSWLERGDLLAGQIASLQCVGVMLHHAVMTDEDLAQLGALLRLLVSCRQARGCAMAELLSLPLDLRGKART